MYTCPLARVIRYSRAAWLRYLPSRSPLSLCGEAPPSVSAQTQSFHQPSTTLFSPSGSGCSGTVRSRELLFSFSFFFPCWNRTSDDTRLFGCCVYEPRHSAESLACALDCRSGFGAASSPAASSPHARRQLAAPRPSRRRRRLVLWLFGVSLSSLFAASEC